MIIKLNSLMLKSAHRRSDIELLRIISMAAVVIVHLNFASVGIPKIDSLSQLFASRNLWQVAVQSFAIIGVNCFALISGFFGIKARWNGGVSFLAQCVCYSVGIFLIVHFFRGKEISFDGLLESCLVLSHNDLWYIPAYFGLYVLSPFINAGCQLLSRRQFSAFLAIFVVFNLWSGWFWKGSFNPTGYTLVQLIMLYLIGRYMSKYPLPKMGTRQFRLVAIVVYILASIANVVLYPYMEASKLFAYNSPIVMIQSVALFYALINQNFTNRAINFIAQSAFAVYLIHKNPLVFGDTLKPLAKAAWGQYNLFGYTLWVMAVLIVLFTISICADTLRRYLWKKIFK